MTLEIARIDHGSSAYPSAIHHAKLWSRTGPIWTIGDAQILKRGLLGFFCSARCPGEVILRAYDMARVLREARIPVIGGFHSPMEKECLDLLLRGRQPIVVCPPRSLQRMRIPSAWREPIDAERLLVLSAFDERHRRATKELGERRNRMVAALASEALIAYAGPQSKTERLCDDLLAAKKKVWALEVDENEPLFRRGVAALPLDKVTSLCLCSRE